MDPVTVAAADITPRPRWVPITEPEEDVSAEMERVRGRIVGLREQEDSLRRQLDDLEMELGGLREGRRAAESLLEALEKRAAEVKVVGARCTACKQEQDVPTADRARCTRCGTWLLADLRL